MTWQMTAEHTNRPKQRSLERKDLSFIKDVNKEERHSLLSMMVIGKPC